MDDLSFYKKSTYSFIIISICLLIALIIVTLKGCI